MGSGVGATEPDDSLAATDNERAPEAGDRTESTAQERPAEASATTTDATAGISSTRSGESVAQQRSDVAEPERTQQAQDEETKTAKKEIDQALIESTDLMVFPEIQSRKSVLTKDELKLRSLPPQHFSLQLLAVSDNDSLQRFITDNQALNSALVYRRVNKGKVMYILLAGEYSDRKSAEAGIANFPDTIRDLKPWVKRISVIQEDVENTENWLLNQ